MKNNDFNGIFKYINKKVMYIISSMVYRPNKNCETDLLFCEVDTGRAMNLLLDYILYFLSDLSNGFIINTKTGTN